MNDFIQKPSLTLKQFRGVVFVGGFSYADTTGSANGWYQVIKQNTRIQKCFDNFVKRSDTFSLGVCNGCQLMVRLGWVPKAKLIQNTSKRFESRFSNVHIQDSPAIMLKNLKNSALGVWNAHGEGKFLLDKDPKSLAPIRYIKPNLRTAYHYPFNPNGSQYGVAALCSKDGRHLAMMPHPERSFLTWQWPVHKKEIPTYKKSYTPWMIMFQNAHAWCVD